LSTRFERVKEALPATASFIIESHSEHFLRRLQRRIAEQELANEDAALYFIHTEGAEARIEALDVDLFGNIKNWPENFFGDEMSDLVARTEAQAQRMQKTGQ
jgi:predicted ATPase